nr:hypothetical protein [Candidatus Protofrankia californiensis]
MGELLDLCFGLREGAACAVQLLAQPAEKNGPFDQGTETLREGPKHVSVMVGQWSPADQAISLQETDDTTRGHYRGSNVGPAAGGRHEGLIGTRVVRLDDLGGTPTDEVRLEHTATERDPVRREVLCGRGRDIVIYVRVLPDRLSPPSRVPQLRDDGAVEVTALGEYLHRRRQQGIKDGVLLQRRQALVHPRQPLKPEPHDLLSDVTSRHARTGQQLRCVHVTGQNGVAQACACVV